MADGTPPMSGAPVRRPVLPKLKKAMVYRYARAAHSYLSAFAFIVLMFFAMTGFLLNRPDVLKGSAGDAQIVALDLDQVALAAALQEEDPAVALGQLIAVQNGVFGRYSSGEVFEEDALLRFAGVKGDTDVFIDFTSARAEIEAAPSGVMQIIRDLHRGKEAGAAWKLLIDVSAILIFLLSAIGFFLFFTMKFRLAASMKLVGASAATLILIFIFLVN